VLPMNMTAISAATIHAPVVPDMTCGDPPFM
jgi:hypothetical protein